MGRAVRRVVGLAVLLALVWLVSVPARIWYDARGDDRPRSDVILVLGAAQYDGTPSPIFRARLEHAQALYRDGVAPVVLTLGGGAVGDRTTEADAGRDWLVARGVPSDAVVAVAQGRNTQQSMDAAGALLRGRGWTTAVVVTDPWHTFRSKALAGAAGIDAVTSPVSNGPVVQTRATQLRYILREWAGYVRWRLTGSSGSGGPEAAA